MMYTERAICDSIDIKFRMGQQASVIVIMSNYDICLIGVSACRIILYNAHIKKITPIGG
jgi:hypothetical protein